ncbi:MAG: glycoside hydrolase family 15 protein, partial [Thermoplasmata archaeon]
RSTSAAVSTRKSLEVDRNGQGAIGEFRLSAGESEWVVCEALADAVTPLSAFRAPQRLAQTVRYWKSWLHRSRYRGRWRRSVERSALLLKLLFYRPTGAMVAAPTTSLPERIGGVRNWDYRFAWVRDTALAVSSLFRLGYVEEATQFVYWLFGKFEEDASEMQIFYTVDGSRVPVEHRMPWLAGYRGSRPVRVGNAANTQVQNDKYGSAVIAAALLEYHGGIVSSDLWRQVRQLVQEAAKRWSRPDNGIWEVRTPARHHVYSKAMCWTALTWGTELGKSRGFDGPFEDWAAEAKAIRQDVLVNGRTPDGESLAWYYGAEGPDASLYRLPSLGFLRASDPVMVATARRMESDLVQDPFVYRYRLPDGLPAGEAFFLPCAFWRANYYVHRGDLEFAKRALESILDRTRPLGLFAEEIDGKGEPRGNFPQAFSHLAFINAATELNGALDRRARRRRSRNLHAPPTSE